MQIEFLASQSWKRTHPGGDYTANKAIETRVPQTLSPLQSVNALGNQAAGDGVIEFGAGGSMAPQCLILLPYGTVASGVIGITIIGWRPTNLGLAVPLWIPTLLAVYSTTLAASGCIGVAGSDLGTTYKFGVTVTCTTGPTFVTSGAAPIAPDWLQISPGGTAQTGIIVQRTYGFNYLEVLLVTTGSNTPAANCLYAKA